MKFSTLLLAIAAIAATSFPADARDIDWVLGQVENNNIELRALTSDNQASAASLSAENALAGPAAEFSPFWQKGVDGLSSSELIVSQEVEFPTIYAARRKAAALENDAAAKRYEASRRDILLEAKLKCLDLARLQAERRYLDARHEYSHEVLRLLARREEEGGATALDVNKTKLEHMSLEAAISVNQASQLEIINALTAMNGGIPLDIDSISYPEEGVIPPLETLSASLLERDAELATANAEIAAARQGVAVSRQSWLPGISAGYRRNAAPGEVQNGFVVGLSFPVWSNTSRVRAARARQTAAELRAEDTMVKAQGDIKNRYYELISLRSVISSYDTDLMDQTLRLLSRAVEAGQLSVLDYYTESDLIYQKLQELTDARHAYHTILAALTKAYL